MARPRVDIRGCDHMISPMLASIIEIAMAMEIRWRGVSQIAITWKKVHGLIIYDYLFESLESFLTCTLLHSGDILFFHSSPI
ncbi:Uncharacterized protein TCM_027937 [Theobroma cacao]|uniref:Uncharacterized protein n=1 Tax=Theobroma cacao TaxID=3641 RepID=A0A061GH51_THECC|nr:Uncharacterized protein TCM_027937 [Theobroma cacao]